MASRSRRLTVCCWRFSSVWSVRSAVRWWGSGWRPIAATFLTTSTTGSVRCFTKRAFQWNWYAAGLCGVTPVCVVWEMSGCFNTCICCVAPVYVVWHMSLVWYVMWCNTYICDVCLCGMTPMYVVQWISMECGNFIWHEAVCLWWANHVCCVWWFLFAPHNEILLWRFRLQDSHTTLYDNHTSIQGSTPHFMMATPQFMIATPHFMITTPQFKVVHHTSWWPHHSSW